MQSKNTGYSARKVNMYVIMKAKLKLLVCVMMISLCVLMSGCTQRSREIGMVIHNISGVPCDTYNACAIGSVRRIETEKESADDEQSDPFAYERAYADYYYQRSASASGKEIDFCFSDYSIVFDDSGNGLAICIGDCGMCQFDASFSRTRDCGITWESVPYILHVTGYEITSALIQGDNVAIVFKSRLCSYSVFVYSADRMNTFSEITIDCGSIEEYRDQCGGSFKGQYTYNGKKLLDPPGDNEILKTLSLGQESVVVGYARSDCVMPIVENKENYYHIINIDLSKRSATTIFKCQIGFDGPERSKNG